MITQPQKIRTPYRLDRIALRFDLPVEELEEVLCNLAAREEIFSHDLNEVDGGHYYLSAYATLRMVLAHQNESEEIMEELGSFFDELPHEGGDELSAIYSEHVAMRFGLKYIELQKQVADLAKTKTPLSIVNVGQCTH